ncbi:MAG: superoxide dismutase family protein [Sphingomonas sp.]|nr:superoxide dismutase family protein [Sphingomonas sp.]
MRRSIAITLAATSLAGCAAVDVPVAAPPVALINSTGQSIGTVVAAQTSGGVTLKMNASGVAHGLHGVHVHAVGRCDTPGFESAGPHWNPADMKHGLNNPQGPHAGDLPNVTASSSGIVNETVVLAGSSLAGLADADGSAVVIHATADDYVTDPSGNSGGRIACAILAPPASRPSVSAN